MKTSHKSILRTLLLTSWASLGTPTANGAIPITMLFAKKETLGAEGEENPFKALNEGMLYGSSSEGQIEGHSSHGSHGSHGSHSSHTSSVHSSHASHASSYPSGGYPSGSSAVDSNGKADINTTLGIVAGSVIGAIIITGITLLIKKSNKNSSRYKYHTKNQYSSKMRQQKDIEKFVAERLRENDVLKFSSNNNGVESMRAYLNVKETQIGLGNEVNEVVNLYIVDKMLQYNKPNFAYAAFQTSKPNFADLNFFPKSSLSANNMFGKQQNEWNRIRQNVISSLSSNTLDISHNELALIGLGSLLSEKGYLKTDSISNDTVETRESILDAYNEFLKSEGMEQSTIINEEIANVLLSK